MTQVMGIVNVTPDSFSDGGQFFRPEEAIRRARNLVAEGADIIDLGGESTRPDATPIGWEEEWARIGPVLAALAAVGAGGGGTPPLPRVSVDTYHPETAERAVAAGASIINCVRAESVPAMLGLLERNAQIELVVPYRGEGAGGGGTPPLPCGGRGATALPRIYLDPMIGFGTTREEDMALLRAIPVLAKRGRVLVGASRKRIVKKLTGEKMTGKNLGGNVGLAVWCAMRGASVVRVHDVKETVQALRVVEALAGGAA